MPSAAAETIADMAGCYGNSAEDRYYERMLDNYLDSLETVEDRYGIDAMKEIERRIESKDEVFVDWLTDNCYIADIDAVDKDTYDTILALLCNDKKVRDAYYDAMFSKVCEELAEKETPEHDIDY